MKWLPYDCWTIESPLDVATLVAGMRERIEPAKFRLFRNRAGTPLHGSIHSGGFTVRRVIHYRNSFLPVLHGTFVPEPRGTSIHIRMMPNIAVSVFLACWLGMTALFALIGFLPLINGETPTLGFFALGMFGFGVAVSYLSFWAEAGRAKQLISEVFLAIHHQESSRQMP